MIYMIHYKNVYHTSIIRSMIRRYDTHFACIFIYTSANPCIYMRRKGRNTSSKTEHLICKVHVTPSSPIGFSSSSERPLWAIQSGSERL